MDITEYRWSSLDHYISFYTLTLRENEATSFDLLMKLIDNFARLGGRAVVIGQANDSMYICDLEYIVSALFLQKLKDFLLWIKEDLGPFGPLAL